MKYCSPKLFSGSGLEITIKVLESTKCTSALYRATAQTGASPIAIAEKLATLSIKNCFMSVVHMMNTAGMALQKQITYLTFNHFKKSLGAGE